MKFRIVIVFCAVIALASCESGNQKLQKKIAANEKQLFADSMLTPSEDSLAKVLIDDYQTFAKQNPTDSLAPEYYFKAADLCKNSRRYKQAIDLWSAVLQQYPKSNKAAYSLFLQAFTYENNMTDTASAKKIYHQFIEKYPTHPLAKSAQDELATMSIPLDELIKQFEEKRAASTAKK